MTIHCCIPIAFNILLFIWNNCCIIILNARKSDLCKIYSWEVIWLEITVNKIIQYTQFSNYQFNLFNKILKYIICIFIRIWWVLFILFLWFDLLKDICYNNSTKTTKWSNTVRKIMLIGALKRSLLFVNLCHCL